MNIEENLALQVIIPNKLLSEEKFLSDPINQISPNLNKSNNLSDIQESSIPSTPYSIKNDSPIKTPVKDNDYQNSLMNKNSDNLPDKSICPIQDQSTIPSIDKSKCAGMYENKIDIEPSILVKRAKSRMNFLDVHKTISESSFSNYGKLLDPLKIHSKDRKEVSRKWSSGNVVLMQQQKRQLSNSFKLHVRNSSRNVMPSKFSSTNLPVQKSNLSDYWVQKQALEAKYEKIINDLEIEEATEIKVKTSMLLKISEQTTAKIVLDTIQKIKDEYEITRGLIIKQKLFEEEELVASCKEKISPVK